MFCHVILGFNYYHDMPSHLANFSFSITTMPKQHWIDYFQFVAEIFSADIKDVVNTPCHKRENKILCSWFIVIIYPKEMAVKTIHISITIVDVYHSKLYISPCPFPFTI